MCTPNANLSYLETGTKNIGCLQDFFTAASTPMSILDAKYEKANIDATTNLLKHQSGMQQQ
jgi:hypothetical protein